MAESGVLITGFPAQITDHLVERLLERREDLCVVLAVEPRLVFVARDRCRELERRHPQLAGRWQIAPADLRQAQLGLSAPALERIRGCVRSIWHLADSSATAGCTSTLAYTLDVVVTTRVLDLCESLPQLELLVYLSSARVAGDRRGRVYEDELDEGQGFADPREQSKHWAELHVQQRLDRIPTVVFRPSAIADPSVSPIAELAAALRDRSSRSPLFDLARSDARVNMVPLEWLVEAMISIAEDPRARGRVFHLSDPRPPRVRELFALVADALESPPPSTLALATGALARTLSRLRSAPEPPIYDLSNSAELLSEGGRPCPRWEDYLPPLMTQLCAAEGARP